jgi:hypothetical protein
MPPVGIATEVRTIGISARRAHDGYIAQGQRPHAAGGHANDLKAAAIADADVAEHDGGAAPVAGPTAAALGVDADEIAVFVGAA